MEMTELEEKISRLDERIEELEYPSAKPQMESQGQEWKNVAKETVRFLYDNAEIIGALAVFFMINAYIWRKLS